MFLSGRNEGLFLTSPPVGLMLEQTLMEEPL